MNNIEILEEQIKYWEDLIKTSEEISPFYTWIKDDKIEERTLALKNLIKENKEMKEIIFNIRHKLKGKVITKNGDNYEPAKNLSKQEVYQTFVDISIYLKANYIFKDDETVLQELLEEGGDNMNDLFRIMSILTCLNKKMHNLYNARINIRFNEYEENKIYLYIIGVNVSTMETIDIEENINENIFCDKLHYLVDKYIKGCLEYANNIEDNEYDTEE